MSGMTQPTETEKPLFPRSRRYDLFFRNPHLYHQQLVECGEFNVAWDRGIIDKRRLDPINWARMSFGNVPWRQYVIGDYFTTEYRSTSDKPVAVYPSWSSKTDSWTDLIDYITNPWGSNVEYCSSDLPDVQRPVYGQPHRVIINEIPNVHKLEGKGLMSRLSDLQEENPQVELYLHGTYSFNVLFNYAFTAGDYEARTHAAKSLLLLPNGIRLDLPGRWDDHRQDIQALGYTVEELQESPAKRCCHNILAARIAAHTWHSKQRMSRKMPDNFVPDIDSPAVTARLPMVGETADRWKASEKLETDQLACNTCSLWRKCSHFREGSVCTLSNSPGKGLSDFFRSKDPHKIVEGLRSIVAKQADRVEDQINNEDHDDPKSAKQIDTNLNSLFRNASTLAKMVDPSLRSGVQVNVLNGQVGGPSRVASILAQDSSPKAIAGSVIQEMEERLQIPREQITDEMVEQYIQDNMPDAGAATVDAEVVDSEYQ